MSLLQKVWFDGKRAIVHCEVKINDQMVLPVGKSGKKCYSSGYYERMSDSDWCKLKWLSESVAKEEGLPIVKHLMYC